MKTISSRTMQAFTFIELLVVIVIMVVLAVLLFPSPHHSGAVRAEQINCVNNLKQVGLSFRLWAGDNSGFYPMGLKTNGLDGEQFANQRAMYLYFQVMSNELNVPKIVVCPADEKRTAATNFESNFNSERVSYFVGLDAKADLPQSLLAGDRNLGAAADTNTFTPPAGYGYSGGTGGGYVALGTNNPVISWSDKMHQRQGNIALGDGSVQKLLTLGVRKALRESGLETNRLVFP